MNSLPSNNISFYDYSIKPIRDKFLTVLTPLQQKVTLVALVILTCLTIGCFYHYSAFNSKKQIANIKQNLSSNINEPVQKVNKEKDPVILESPKQKEISPKLVPLIEKKKKELSPLDLTPQVEQLDSPEVPTELDLLQKAQNLKKAELKVKSLTPEKTEISAIFARLEKNRNYALLQQQGEPNKGFLISNKPIPSSIQAFVQYKGTFDMPIEGKQETISNRQVGVGFCQGKRPTMEDTEIAAHQAFKIKDKDYTFDIFGVFDGHGGDKASGFVKTHIEQYFKEALVEYNQEELTDEGIFNAFKESFKKLDSDYQGSDGTTATVAVLLNDKIWVANTGDSRTILVKSGGHAIQTSEDAKPTLPRYKKTIEKLGGMVMNGRINAVLAVGRAIGDKTITSMAKETAGQCCVSPNPKITCYSLKDFQDGHLVLACDGLYDVATTNEVGFAIHQLAQNKESVENMSKSLVFNAIDQGSMDNITVLIVKL